jgi:hypothetical protein
MRDEAAVLLFRYVVLVLITFFSILREGFASIGRMISNKKLPLRVLVSVYVHDMFLFIEMPALQHEVPSRSPSLAPPPLAFRRSLPSLSLSVAPPPTPLSYFLSLPPSLSISLSYLYFTCD